ncbi:diguanylate cyclase [Lysobacter humi (ex Lee et al. 2017)]
MTVRHALLLLLALLPAFADAAPDDGSRSRRPRRAPLDPATLQLEPVAAVLVDRDRDTVPDRKGKAVRVRGVVTVPTGVLRENGFQVLIQDATGGMGLYNRSLDTQLAAGDVVEAWGEVSQYKGAVQLQDVQVRRIGTARLPAAPTVAVAEADGPAHLGRRIRIEGVVGGLTLDTYGMLRITGDDGGSIPLFIPAALTDDFDWKALPRGTRVAAVGVHSLFKPTWPYDGGYQLVMASPADLKVLQPPRPELPAWIPWAIGGTAATLLLGLLGFHLAQRRQRARELELKTLSALSAALAQPGLSDAQLARQACGILTAYGVVEAAMVHVFDERGCLVQLAISASDPRLAPALESTEPLCATDGVGPAQSHQIEAHAADKGLRVLAIHPLLATTGSLGFLVALSPRKRRPNEMQERTLLAAVKLLAMSLDNQRMQERARIEQQELQQLVITDELTRLYNRRFLEEYLRVQIPLAKRRGGGLAFLAIDIDHFKAINDTHGHEAGDRVLAGIGAQLCSVSRGADLPVRLGGEEFLLVVAEHEVDGALTIAERVRAAIAEHPFEAGGERLRVTVSVGVALFGLHGDDMPTLLRASDEAMYASKRAGRDRVTLSTAIGTIYS